jgi:hypothetical protein
MLSDLARILRAAADEAERIADEQRGERRSWIPQTGSPLGSRRHCAAVDRRIAAGEPGAARVGRRRLLAPHALDEELARVSRGERPAAEGDGVTARIERRLGVVAVGRR